MSGQVITSTGIQQVHEFDGTIRAMNRAASRRPGQPRGDPMKQSSISALLAIAALASPVRAADPPPYYSSIWNPSQPGIAYGFAASLQRSGGSTDPLRDFTVAAQLTA